MRPSFPLVLLLSALALAPLAAGQQPTESQKSPLSGRTSLFVQIMDRTETGFRVRPWNPDLPRRVEMEPGEGMQVVRQKTGRVRDLVPGELVLVLAEDPALVARRNPRKPESPKATSAKEPDDADDAALRKADSAEEPDDGDESDEPDEMPDDAGKPRRTPHPARAVLRLWPAEGEAVRPLDERRARALLQAAQPFFTGKRFGGVDAPGSTTYTFVGVVRRTDPLFVQGRQKGRRFQLHRKTLVINHLPLKPSDLKRSQTLLIQGRGEAGPEPRVTVLFAAVCPERTLTGERMRRFLRREYHEPKEGPPGGKRKRQKTVS